MPYGCDFLFMNANMEYNNMERILDYVNKNNKNNIKFMISTPSEYVEALKKEHATYKIKHEDGFPYSNT